MCSEPDNDRKPNEVVCWTGQINQVRESTQAMLRKEPRSWMQRATPDTCREAREEQVDPDRKHGLYLHGTMVLIPHVLPVRSLLVTLQIQTAAIKTVAVQHLNICRITFVLAAHTYVEIFTTFFFMHRSFLLFLHNILARIQTLYFHSLFFHLWLLFGQVY